MKDSEKAVLSDPSSFDDLLDKTCERLWDKKKQYTLRRLRELDDNLNSLEQELEQIVFDSGINRAERVR
ncbi:hypothetical protein LQZ21_08645 [Treponema sp. TIM-1]|uniref:hypothetical protein n=1 Tax=Treponema sp. TIM-1 TaxID=2898417 RepID=UPI00398088DB